MIILIVCPPFALNVHHCPVPHCSKISIALPLASVSHNSWSYQARCIASCGKVSLCLQDLYGGEYTCRVDPDDSIEVLQGPIARKMGVSAHQLRFERNRQKLGPERTLRDNNIQNDEVLDLYIEMTGGGPGPSMSFADVSNAGDAPAPGIQHLMHAIRRYVRLSTSATAMSA